MIKYIFIYLSLFTFSLTAQDRIDTSASFSDNVELKIGYTGNILWNNGLTFGAEYLWKEKVNTKNKKGKQKTITNQCLLNGNLAFTNNFSTETDAGIFTNFGFILRRTNTKGKQISIELNPLGYYRSFLPETYEVNGNDVDKVFLPGRGYYAPSLSIGLGKFRKDKKLTGRYFNINIMYRVPYNAGAIPSISLQYGYRFNYKKRK